MEALINFLTSSPDTEYFFVLSSVFAGGLFLSFGLYFSIIKPMSRKQLISQRIWGGDKKRLIHPQLFRAQLESQGSPILSLVKKIGGWGKVEKLQRSLYQADIFCSLEAFLGVAGILACGGFLLGTLTDKSYLRIALAAVLGLLPYPYLRLKRRRKTVLLEKQMPEGMDLLSRSLRAGHTLQSAMEMVSGEIGAPLGAEIKIAYEEQRLGLGLNKALRRMADRVDSQDLRFFVTSVLIQSETGGNLAEILENIGQLIRARLQLKGKISGLTAEGRFSALILSMLPIAIFLILYFVNRDYMMLLWTDPLGNKLLLGGVISMALGTLWMKKMIQIKV